MTIKPTCFLCIIFFFHSECFFNLYIFTLLFNERHHYNSVPCRSQSLQQEFFCGFEQFVMLITNCYLSVT